MSVNKTLEERGSRYGRFADHAQIAQGIQDVMRSHPNWYKLDLDMKQALSVIADKIARILNGDPFYGDNWHDIQGYAKLIEDRISMIPDQQQELYATGGEVSQDHTYIVGEEPTQSYVNQDGGITRGGSGAYISS